MAQRHVVGVAAHQVPGDADKSEQQHPDENVERERIRDHERKHDCGRRERGNANTWSRPECRLHRAQPPNKPLGRSAKVSSSMAKTTISPESAPTNCTTSDSAAPIIDLAISAPVILPSVPKTTATNAISTKTCPTSG